MRLASLRSASWLRPAATALYLAIVGFLGVVTLRDRGPEVSETLELLSASDIAVAVTLGMGALVLSMLAWRRILSGFGTEIDIGVASEIFFISQVGKYLPGSVWPAVTQVLLGRAHQVPGRANAWSFVTAMAMSLLTGSLIGGLVLSISESWVHGAVFVCLVTIAGAATVRFGPGVVARVPRARSKLPTRLPAVRVLLEASVLFAGQWVLHGLHIAFLLDRMGVGGDTLVPRSIGAFALAFAAGTLFIIAPAGLGIREGALVALLTPLGASSAVALAASLTSRFVLTIADLVAALVASAIAVRRKLRASNSSG